MLIAYSYLAIRYKFMAKKQVSVLLIENCEWIEMMVSSYVCEIFS